MVHVARAPYLSFFNPPSMPVQDILCATDLTPVSDAALRHAVLLAGRTGARISQLHVLGRSEQSPEARAAVVARMAEQVARCQAGHLVTPMLLEGDFMKQIAEETARDHALLVLGTHGPHGLRQSLFGADILKLVRHSAIPALVVQENSPANDRLDRIVLPVASHADIDRLLDMVCFLARAYAAEVHVFQLIRPNESPSAELLGNKTRMLERLQREGLRHQEVNEPSTVFSIGFAEPTILYAERIGAGAIAIMSHASDEYRYMADAEKERMLTNHAHIPVLCA
jgi:nucleotide-binding universal stress UspA family protein